MTARVSQAEVLAIAPAITLADITPFIDAASLIVDDLNTRCGKSFDAARLKEIERFLSAHLASFAVGTGSKDKSRESIARGDYDVSYATSKLGQGILGTTYGQTANLLSEGCLVEWDKRQSQLYAAGAND